MLTLTHHTERDLLELTATGDQAAFNELFHRFKFKLFNYMHKLTGSQEQAEDIVQEVFIKVWEVRTTLPEIQNLNAWMFAVAHNKAVSSFRHWARERKMLQEILYADTTGAAPNATQPADQALSLKEAEALIAKAIEALPPQQQTVYKLSREQGLKHEEIARRLQLAPGTVNNHMIRALKTLREVVEKHRGNAALLALFITIVDAFDR